MGSRVQVQGSWVKYLSDGAAPVRLRGFPAGHVGAPVVPRRTDRPVRRRKSVAGNVEGGAEASRAVERPDTPAT